jgi:septum site-determining protein MinD
MGKIIVVASGKGGTGKTTTAAAVASSLAALGHKTLCVDFDAALNNLDLSLCMDEYAVADFTDVLAGRLPLMDACHECPRIPNLYFLSAPAFGNIEFIDGTNVGRMYDEIRARFDYCLIDSPSGIGAGFELAQRYADMSLIVTTGEMPAIRDAQKTAEAARAMGVGEVRLLVNRVVPKNLRWMKITLDDIIDTVEAQLIGVVREDSMVYEALHAKTPLVLYKRRHAAYDFLDAARRARGENLPLRYVARK